MNQLGFGRDHAKVPCVDCIRALQQAWHGYRAECVGCEVRAIASSPREVREAAYERMQRECGGAARKTLVSEVKLEIARQIAQRIERHP